MKSSSHNSAAFDTVRLVYKALDEKKAEDVCVLDVSEQSSITDYLVIATGTSEPHLRALRVELEKVLDAAKVRIVGMDTDQGSGWMVVDAFDVMVHVFTREMRANYKLETLWKDATRVSHERILGLPEKPEVVAKPSKPSRKPAAKTQVKKTAGKAAKKVSTRAKTAKKAAPAKSKAAGKKPVAVKKTGSKAKPAVRKAQAKKPSKAKR